jgi:hypothetical protein
MWVIVWSPALDNTNFMFITVCFVCSRSMQASGTRKGPMMGKREFTPVTWDHYFEKMSEVTIDGDVSFGTVVFYSYDLFGFK